MPVETTAQIQMDWIVFSLLAINVVASGLLCLMGMYTIYRNHLRNWWRPLIASFTLMAGADTLDTAGRAGLRLEHVLEGGAISHDMFRLFTTLSASVGWLIMFIVVIVYFSPLQVEARDDTGEFPQVK